MRYALPSFLATVLTCFSACVAQAAEGTIDSAATNLLKEVCDVYRDAQTVRGAAEMNWRIVTPQWDQNVRSRYKIFVDKPNRFALQMTNGSSGGSVVSNGEQMFTHMPLREAYSVEDVYSSKEAVHSALQLVAGSSGMPGISLVGFLTGDAPYSSIMDGVTAAEYVGEDKIKGKKCEHIRLTRGDDTWDLWLTTGKRPGVLLFESTVPEGEIGFENYVLKKEDTLTARVHFESWKFDKKMRDKYFAYKTPRNTREVESFTNVVFAVQEDPMVGEKAPSYSFALLEGGKANSKEHKGEVVVLDFWATWCGWCVKAMPEIIEVTDDMEDRGVRLYAVNQNETDKQVKDFLKRKGFDCVVAMDPGAKIGQKFGVRGLPMTVIIGPDGVVHAVHRGYRTDLKDVLRKDIEDALNNKS